MSLKLTFSVTLLLLIFGLQNASSQGVEIDRIVAKVDNHIILKSMLDKAYLDYLSRGSFDLGNPKCELLESLIISKLLVAKAEIDSVEVSDDEVNMQLESRIRATISHFGSEEKLEEFYGKTLEEFKSELFDDMKEQLLVQRMQGEVTSNVKVTPSEVKAFYKNIPRDSLPYISAEVSIAQIVRIPKANKMAKQVVKDQLAEIREKILAGEDFGEMAKMYSMDPGSGKAGGEIGFSRRGELAPEYEAAALKLNINEISLPFESKFGVHIVQLLERRGNLFRTRHILIVPRPTQEDHFEAKNYLDSIKNLVLQDSMTFEKAAKEFSEDVYTSGNGGYFLDNTGAPKMAVDSKDMDPVTFFTLDSMEIGAISPPLEYTMVDGSKSYRIILYKDRIPPHQASLRLDYQKFKVLTKNVKTNKVLEEWFQEARNEVFIEITPEFQHCQILK